MHMTARGHGDIARVKRKPFAPPDRDLGIVYRAAEYLPGELNLARGERALTADGAKLRIAQRRIVLKIVQRSSPAPLISALTVVLSPEAIIKVSSVVPPAFNSSDTFIAMP